MAAVETSTTEAKAIPITSDEDLGRMITACQRIVRQTGGGYWSRTTVRVYTNQQIASAFGITLSRLEMCAAKYRNQSRFHRWTDGRISTQVLKWAIKHGRWPRNADWHAWKTNGLGVPRQSMSRHTSLDGIQERLIRDDKQFAKLTPQLILDIRNVTIRREAMLKYGGENLLIEQAGSRVQEDDFGVLWDVPPDAGTTDKVARYVQVTNSTPEPDGSFAKYFLRVPPATATAKEAVEWSFDVELPEGFTVQT